MMNSICAIGVYFGKLPNYFELWLKSAQSNSSIDFFVFTDDHVKEAPANVRIIHMTLDEMKSLAERKLQQSVALDRPYKCCDFKPVYGTIFEDYVADYKYWGHFDIDIIMGDIYGFMVKNEYEKYDRFMHLGHFSFYRNTDTVKAYYKLPGSLVGDYMKVFSTPKAFAFDELLGMGNIYFANNLPIFTKKIYADISCHHKRFRLSELCCVQEKVVNYKHQAFYWKDGKVFRCYLHHRKIYHEEFAYVHLQKRPNFMVNFDSKSVNAFYIGVNGFQRMLDNDVTKTAIRETNPYPGLFREWFETCRFRLDVLLKKTMAKLGMSR